MTYRPNAVSQPVDNGANLAATPEQFLQEHLPGMVADIIAKATPPGQPTEEGVPQLQLDWLYRDPLEEGGAGTEIGYLPASVAVGAVAYSSLFGNVPVGSLTEEGQRLVAAELAAARSDPELRGYGSATFQRPHPRNGQPVYIDVNRVSRLEQGERHEYDTAAFRMKGVGTTRQATVYGGALSVEDIGTSTVDVTPAEMVDLLQSAQGVLSERERRDLLSSLESLFENALHPNAPEGLAAARIVRDAWIARDGSTAGYQQNEQATGRYRTLAGTQRTEVSGAGLRPIGEAMAEIRGLPGSQRIRNIICEARHPRTGEAIVFTGTQNLPEDRQGANYAFSVSSRPGPDREVLVMGIVSPGDTPRLFHDTDGPGGGRFTTHITTRELQTMLDGAVDATLAAQ